jgi:hypothetical protein
MLTVDEQFGHLAPGKWSGLPSISLSLSIIHSIIQLSIRSDNHIFFAFHFYPRTPAELFLLTSFHLSSFIDGEVRLCLSLVSVPFVFLCIVVSTSILTHSTFFLFHRAFSQPHDNAQHRGTWSLNP